MVDKLNSGPVWEKIDRKSEAVGVIGVNVNRLCGGGGSAGHSGGGLRGSDEG